jgi:hypothetical protein
VTHRPHGSYVKYVQEQCRCEPCRAANRDYQRAATSRIEPPYVSASAARAHIRDPAAAGAGLKTIAKAGHVSHGTLSKLMYGDRTRGMAPSKRIRRSTHDRILAVTPAAARGTSRVDATTTKALLAEMIGAGVPKVRIAAELGSAAPGLQIGRRQQVNAATAAAVAALHARWTTGEWVPVRRDRYGNTTPTPAPAIPRRPSADISDLLLDLAEIVETRNDQAAWRQSAACRNRPSYLWFPTRGDTEVLDAGLKICAACMVRAQCRAANFDQPVGTYGGIPASARRAVHRIDVTAVADPAARCGTNAGYSAHRRRGEDACTACRLAHAHYVQDSARDRSKVPA